MSAAPIRCPELGGCENRAQCWEPCGFLGKSAAHARPASAETTAAVNAALTTQPAGALPEPQILARNEYGVPIARGYTADTVRAMMAERDAAREAVAYLDEMTKTLDRDWISRTLVDAKEDMQQMNAEARPKWFLDGIFARIDKAITMLAPTDNQTSKESQS